MSAITAEAGGIRAGSALGALGQTTLNPRVRGSSPWRRTRIDLGFCRFRSFFMCPFCPHVGSALARELRPGRGRFVNLAGSWPRRGLWHPSWLDNFLDQWSIPSVKVLHVVLPVRYAAWKPAGSARRTSVAPAGQAVASRPFRACAYDGSSGVSATGAAGPLRLRRRVRWGLTWPPSYAGDCLPRRHRRTRHIRGLREEHRRFTRAGHTRADGQERRTIRPHGAARYLQPTPPARTCPCPGKARIPVSGPAITSAAAGCPRRGTKIPTSTTYLSHP
jgi:hypothetical protein